MPPRLRRRARGGMDYWPGFVDALSTMLLAFVFLVTVFMVAQFFLSRDVTGKDAALQKLNKQIAELTALLSLEQSGKSEAQTALTGVAATLEAERKDKADLQARLGAEGERAGAAAGALAQERALSAQAQARVDALNQQIAALRKQLAAIEEALQTSEARDKEAQSRIADLGARLNVALAQKVQELNRYRSDFFGRLRGILADRPDVRIVGDRFALDSDVLFDSGQAVLTPAAGPELDKIAEALKDLERSIPADIGWVMRVDGHTDKRPIASATFPSNWELSTARAVAVVRYLIARGVRPDHLVAAGFGEFQPLDKGDGDEALRRNRRIELKLTDR